VLAVADDAGAGRDRLAARRRAAPFRSRLLTYRPRLVLVPGKGLNGPVEAMSAWAPYSYVVQRPVGRLDQVGADCGPGVSLQLVCSYSAG
jgi:hypothetical protein